MRVFLLALVVPLFAQDIQVVIETPDGTSAFLQNAPITFMARNISQVDYVDYAWDFGDGSLANGSVVTHTFANTGHAVIMLTGIDVSGNASVPFYTDVYINAADGPPPETWLGYLTPDIVAPDFPLLIQAGHKVTFQARSEAEAASYWWRIGGSDQAGQSAIWTWQVPADWSNFYTQVDLLAAHPDGVGTPYGDSGLVYVYSGTRPPDTRLVAPMADTDGLFRMRVGEPLTFVAQGQTDLAEDLTFRWQLQARGASDGICDNYDIDFEDGFGSTYTFTPSESGRYCFVVEAIDIEGNEDPYPYEFQVLVKEAGTNQAPNGRITRESLRVNVGEEVTMAASGSDTDGDVLNYKWSLGNGQSATGEAVTFSYNAGGVYRVQLTANDGMDDDPTPFYRWVFVNDPQATPINAAPNINLLQPKFGSTHKLGSPVMFSASATDYDDESTSIYWDYGDGTLGQGATVSKRYTQTGNYAVQGFVVDEKGWAGAPISPTQIHIYSDATPPEGVILEPRNAVSDAGGVAFVSATIGSSVQLRGAIRNVDDASAFNVTWRIQPTNDSGIFSDTLEGLEPDLYTFTVGGLYYVQLLIDDGAGREDVFPAEIYFDVRENLPPEVEIVEPSDGLTVQVDQTFRLVAAEAQDPDGDAVSYTWQIGEQSYTGQKVEEASAATPGVYTISLQVEDAAGNMSTAQRVPILVQPSAVAEGYLPVRPQFVYPQQSILTGGPGATFRLEAARVDEDGRELSTVHWRFSDGRTFDEFIPGSSTFGEPGYYNVRLYAADADGVWSPWYRSLDIYIHGENLPPSARIIEPPLTESADDQIRHTVEALIGQEISLKGSATDADSHYPLALDWTIAFESFSTSAEPDALSIDTRGVYHLGLSAFDAEFASDPIGDYRRLVIADPNIKPESYIAQPDHELLIAPGEPLTFVGFGHDPNKLQMSYHWDFGAGAAPATAEGSSVTVTFNQETPENEPLIVTMQTRTRFTEDPTPAEIRIHVRQVAEEDLEPNNDLAEGRNLILGEYKDLLLAPGDPSDVYRFEVADQGRDLRFALNSDGEIRTSLYQLRGDAWLPISRNEEATTELIYQNADEGTYALVLEDPLVGKRSRNLSYSLSLVTLQPRLHLPFTVEDGNFKSTIGLINPNNSEVNAVILGLDINGSPVTELTQTLAPHSKMLVDSDDLLGSSNGVSMAKVVRWLQVRASARLVGYVNNASEDGLQLMSSGALKNLHSQVLVPHIAADTFTWYTRAVVINDAKEAVDLDFNDDTGTPSVIGKVNANSQTDFRLNDHFETLLPGWGSFSGAELGGLEIFGRRDGPSQVAALEMIPRQELNGDFFYRGNNVAFTHVAADTLNFWTGIALINYSQTDAPYVIRGYNDDGQVVEPVLEGTLAAGGKLLNTVGQLFGEAHDVRWIDVEAEVGVAGFELFGDHVAKRLAGFPTVGYGSKMLYFPHIQDQPGETWTGIALVNLADEETTLTLRAYAANGSLLQEKTQILAGRTKVLSLVGSLFEGFNLDGGYVEVEASPGTINGFELFGTLGEADQMAGLPAQTR